MAACAIFLTALTGCPAPESAPSSGNPEATNPDPAEETITAEVLSFKSNFPISQLHDPIDVLYTVTGMPSRIDGFYVPVVGGGGEVEGSVPIVIAADLPTGEVQSFAFDPRALGVGYYKVGIIITDGVEQMDLRSQGTIQIQGPPAPRFLRPTEAEANVYAGTDVVISFDAGDPEGDAQWRLFYTTDQTDPNTAIDERGVSLAVSVDKSDVGGATLVTSNLPPGEYALGLSATDAGGSISATVADGNESQIVTVSGPVITILAEPPAPKPPTITVTAPNASGVVLFGDQPFDIQFAAIVREEDATGSIEVFYDADADVSNGFEVIASGVDVDQLTWPFPLGLPEGEYRVGARVDDGISDPVIAWAAGTVTVIRSAFLEVTAPDSPVPVRPGAPVTVVWSTNVSESAGSVRVYYRSVALVQGVELPVGDLMPVTAELGTNITTAPFVSEESGVFALYVGLTVVGKTEQLVQAPEFVRVSSLPTVLWLGSLAMTNPSFEGAILEGVNFEDNAGSAFAAAGDLDSDGYDDFVIVARYGKPFFVNPTGIGPGEAYIVYGAGGDKKLIGSHNLNSLGTTLLRGVLLTGIRTVGDSDETEGLSDVTLVPDVGNDGLGELVFGFPMTNSRWGKTPRPLTKAGQFLAGGVVILSSDNSLLLAPDSGNPVINLDEVGQDFSDMTLRETWEVVLDTCWLSPQGCKPGPDGLNDTVIAPYEGFIEQLVDPLHEVLSDVLGYDLIAPGTPCSIKYRPWDAQCSVDGIEIFSAQQGIPGSGYYPTGAHPLDPKGARIIGNSEGDRFGSSVTVSIPVDEEDLPGDLSVPPNLIISAPNRSASADFIDVLDSDISGSGVGYMVNHRSLWTEDFLYGDGLEPPTPHQYVVGTISHCGDNRTASLGALRIAGAVNDGIQNIIGIDDFNADGRNDFAIGAPNAFGGTGRVYIAFRRDHMVEGHFLLDRLALDPNDPERLEGVLLRSTTPAALGASLASGVDLNGDGISDLVIGSPNANAGLGEVIVVFGNPSLTSPINGISTSDLLLQRDSKGNPRAARITGNPRDLGGQFGFNVANAGDVDGDGLNDLLIAAPNATPRFDSDPTDNIDELDHIGVDMNFDGVQDDVSGPSGAADTIVNAYDDLVQAGIVYVILGSNRLDSFPGQQITMNIDRLGSNQLRGYMIAGRRSCDHLGGGDAGEPNACDNPSQTVGKTVGRSDGLGTAGDVDGDGRADILIGSILANPRVDPATGVGKQNGGEAYLIYSSGLP